MSGVEENRTIACNDSTVTISGVDNIVVLTGHCARVDVSGVRNVVTVDAADSIVASGMNNKITYPLRHPGWTSPVSTTAFSGAEPRAPRADRDDMRG